MGNEQSNTSMLSSLSPSQWESLSQMSPNDQQDIIDGILGLGSENQSSGAKEETTGKTDDKENSSVKPHDTTSGDPDLCISKELQDLLNQINEDPGAHIKKEGETRVSSAAEGNATLKSGASEFIPGALQFEGNGSTKGHSQAVSPSSRTGVGGGGGGSQKFHFNTAAPVFVPGQALSKEEEKKDEKDDQWDLSSALGPRLPLKAIPQGAAADFLQTLGGGTQASLPLRSSLFQSGGLPTSFATPVNRSRPPASFPPVPAVGATGPPVRGRGGKGAGRKALERSMMHEKLWTYVDPQSAEQGPFSTLEMRAWLLKGYFDSSLRVSYRGQPFRLLGELYPEVSSAFEGPYLPPGALG